MNSQIHVSVWESLVEVCVDSGLLWCQRHWQQQSCEGQHVGISPLGECHHQPYHRTYSHTIQTADSRTGLPHAKL